MFWKRKAKNQDDAEETENSVAAVDDDSGAESEDEEGGEPEDEEGGAEPEGPDPVERLETSGVFEVHDEEYEVTNNTWIIRADDEGVIVVDPAHDAKAVLEAVGDREIYLVACTNGYSPHIAAAVEVAERDDAPVALHRQELRAWRKIHGIEHRIDLEIEGGGSLDVGDISIKVLAVPGTSPGTVAYYIEELNLVCPGDTLLAGELGTVGEEYVDYTQQLASVGEVLLELPGKTRVLPDRGEETTVGAESKNFDSWVSGKN